jgi:hypothetical protein
MRIAAARLPHYQEHEKNEACDELDLYERRDGDESDAITQP